LLTLSGIRLTPRGRRAEQDGLGRGAGFELTHAAV
jgi:hypothetical protein